MLPCPTCKRRIVSRRDILTAPIDGTTRCPACGQFARLDVFSRWVLSCLVALLLPPIHLGAGVFYSGHLLFLSMIIIIAAWRAMAWAALPLLALEPVPERLALDRRQSMIIGVALFVTAIALDAFIASRFDPDDAIRDAEAPAAVRNLQR